MYISSVSTVTAIIVFIITKVHSQNDEKQAIDNIFNNNGGGFLPPGFEEVTTKAPESFGAIEKCGQGESEGVDLCVPYYQCDSETKTIIANERTDGFGVIDIRFGEDKPCDHYLDVCCKIPPGGVPSSTTEDDAPIIDPEPSKPEEPIPDDQTPEVPDRRPQDPWTCGIRNQNGIDFKITGNKDHEAEYGEFPWMVALIKTKYNPPNENQLVCGGSLITPNVVLTAAHCVYKFKTNEIRVRLGEWDTQTTKERLPFEERNIKEIIIHEEFNSQVLFNDVALIIMESPVHEAEHIGTICLPDEGQVFNSKHCIATGWGKHIFGADGVYQAILKKVELPVVPNRECQERLRKTRLGKYFVLDKSFMCAGGLKGFDTCTGDGGSPYVCPDPNQPHRYIQAGIVAWGIGCGEEIPAVYASVAQFRSWIDSKMRLLNGGNI